MFAYFIVLLLLTCDWIQINATMDQKTVVERAPLSGSLKQYIKEMRLKSGGRLRYFIDFSNVSS